MKKRFAVALSFPGEHRRFVRNVANALASELGKERVFFDEWYGAELAGVDGDLKLGKYYREQSELIVPFFSAHYSKSWCKIEWRTVRTILHDCLSDDAVVPVELDDTRIEGWESVDFSIRRGSQTGKQIAEQILAAYLFRFPSSDEGLEKPDRYQRLTSESPVQQDAQVLGGTSKPRSIQPTLPKRAAVSNLAPPDYHGYQTRSSLTEALKRALNEQPIVSVSGLSGTGKTSGVANHFGASDCDPRYDAIYWYEVDVGETLEEVLDAIEHELGLKTQFHTVRKRCQGLRSLLRKNNAVLVLDDFHTAVRPSFEPLFSVARGGGCPARLLVISQFQTVSRAALGSIAPVTVPGFDLNEAELFLKTKAVDADKRVIRRLVAQTDGLPAAVSLFSVLIESGRFSPNELLDELSAKGQELRLDFWFDHVKSMLNEKQFLLLEGISLADDRFGSDVLRAVASTLGLRDHQSAIAKLSRGFLLQRYPHDRWRVHSLAASFCRQNIGTETKKKWHQTLANHYAIGIPLKRTSVLSDEQLFDLENACGQLQSAGDFGRAETYLRAISKTAKGRGFYRRFMRLCDAQIENHADRSRWVDYDYAHCCLIVGQHSSAMRILQPLVGDSFEPSLDMQIARLYAEVHLHEGNPQAAYDLLRGAIKSAADERIHSAVRGQCLQSLADCLVGLERFDEAEHWIEQLWEQTGADRQSDVGRAAALTRWGNIARKCGRYADAHSKLLEARTLFASVSDQEGRFLDRRGLAWATFSQAQCLFELGELVDAENALDTAIGLKREIDDVSSSYLEELRSLAKFRLTLRGTKLVEQEIDRIRNDS